MSAQPPALAPEILKQSIPLLFREWIGTRHDSPGPLEISERKAGLYTSFSRVAYHRAQGTVDHVPDGLEAQIAVDLKARPEFFEMRQR